MHFLNDSVIEPSSSINFFRNAEDAVGLAGTFLLEETVCNVFFDIEDFESEDFVVFGLLIVRRIVLAETAFPILFAGSLFRGVCEGFAGCGTVAPTCAGTLNEKVIPPDPLPVPPVEVANPVPAEAFKAVIPGALAPTKFGSAIKFDKSPKYRPEVIWKQELSKWLTKFIFPSGK
jgi:hypothetical protein